MSKFLPVLPLVLMALLAACGSESDKAPPKPAVSGATSPSAAPAPAPTPQAPATYDATPADGIQFSREGYPRFVREVKGVSGREEFGRWTDGAKASFVFADPLPKKFTLTIETTAPSVRTRQAPERQGGRLGGDALSARRKCFDFLSPRRSIPAIDLCSGAGQPGSKPGRTATPACRDRAQGMSITTPERSRSTDA